MRARALSVRPPQLSDCAGYFHEFYLCKPLLNLREDIACAVECLTVKDGRVPIQLLPLSLPLFDLEVFHILVDVISNNSLIQELSPSLNTSPVLWNSRQFIITFMIRVVI